MKAPIRFAVLGYGHIGRRHAQHIQANPEAVLSALCDNDPNVKKSAPEGIPFFEHVDALLAAGIADVCCVCSPNYLHEAHCIAALNAGLHAVVEKPMAISSESCDRMIAAAERSGNKIFAVKQNRYNPPVQALKHLLDSGGMGRIYLVQVNGFWNRGDAYYAQSTWRGKKDLDGGVLFTQFSHFVDILLYLAGSISSAKGQIRNFAHQHNTEIEDTGSFSMVAESGALVDFCYTTCAYGQNMEGAISIFGEKAAVKIGGQYLNTIEYQHLSDGSLPEINIAAKANDYGSYQGSMSNHDQVIQNVIDVLLHGKPIMTSAAEAREVVRIIEMMYAAAKQ
ncbi:MAG: Gfo/Idh/MocA family oxidoreductase [Bacteroidetes bacterium]|nr:Gfo/Idh/MocA family oxidoreductase [Bacteroidota bacterium]MBS1629990.1 Gfo/Idh/MocA family oxidoreductase [Bacteroidota bacterium]